MIEVAQRKRSAAEWGALIREYAKRKGTALEFCPEHGVAGSTLDWWRRRLDKTSRSSGVRSKSRLVAASQLVSFIELPATSNAAPRPWDIELVLGEGMVLRLLRSMLRIEPARRIWLCTTSTDMRKSFDGVAADVRSRLGEDLVSGHWFAFINRRCTHI